MRRIIISAALILSVLHFDTAGAEPSVFRKIIDDYLSVCTIRASITQYIYNPDGPVEVFSGEYSAAAGGFIRIDYALPEHQLVILNESGLYWYYPERKILFTSPAKGNGSDSVPFIVSSIPPGDLQNLEVISYGIRFYSFFRKAEVYSVTSKKSGTRLVLWIDPSKKTVIRKYILDESGREIVREDYTSHVNINGREIPSVIEFRARGAAGVIHTVTEYRSIVINGRVNRELFKFRITPDMKVRLLNDK